MKHDRFDEDHRNVCADCYDAWLDFCEEQEDQARLDRLIEQGEE